MLWPSSLSSKFSCKRRRSAVWHDQNMKPSIGYFTIRNPWNARLIWKSILKRSLITNALNLVNYQILTATILDMKCNRQYYLEVQNWCQIDEGMKIAPFIIFISISRGNYQKAMYPDKRLYHNNKQIQLHGAQQLAQSLHRNQKLTQCKIWYLRLRKDKALV